MKRCFKSVDLRETYLTLWQSIMIHLLSVLNSKFVTVPDAGEGGERLDLFINSWRSPMPTLNKAIVVRETGPYKNILLKLSG